MDTDRMDIAQAHVAALVEAAKRRALQRQRELEQEAANVDVDARVSH